MPREPSADFITTKNAETNEPIWLYRIATSDNPNEDLFFAEYHENVEYFKDTNTAQTYTAFPMAHQGIAENLEDQVDNLQVTVANVSRAIQAYLEQNDGLRDRKVTIRQVFAEHLNDDSAYIEDIYYVYTVSVTDKVAVFTLTTRLEVLNIVVPSRQYVRNHCPWTYKEYGCWIDDGGGGWNMPTGFLTGSPDTCARNSDECDRHANEERFGGFPSVPTESIYQV